MGVLMPANTFLVSHSGVDSIVKGKPGIKICAGQKLHFAHGMMLPLPNRVRVFSSRLKTAHKGRPDERSNS